MPATGTTAWGAHIRQNGEFTRLHFGTAWAILQLQLQLPMTPYWPSPLGATRRRLAPRPEVQTYLFSTDSFRSRAPVTRRFPKPNPGIRWVAEADLPTPSDFKLGPDGHAPEVG